MAPILLLAGLGAAAALLASRRPGSAASTDGGASVFGAGVLSQAQEDLGVSESGAGAARVTQMLSNVGVTVPANWCAAAVSTWVSETASNERVADPIRPSAGAKDLMQQFRSSNPRLGWLDASTLQANPQLVEPGMVAVWQRGSTGSWMGHIGIVESGGPGMTFTSIEGNSGRGVGSVARSTHDLTGPTFLGMGYFIDTAIYAQSESVGAIDDFDFDAPPSVPMPRAGVYFGESGSWLDVEVATSPSTRARGLSMRHVLAWDRGMLFEFPDDNGHTMQMSATFLPLDMIFVDAGWRIVGILSRVPPLSRGPYGVAALSRRVIEASAGWAAAHDVHVGDTLQLSISTPAARGGAQVGYLADPPGIETFAP